jgi:hypothetical protein
MTKKDINPPLGFWRTLFIITIFAKKTEKPRCYQDSFAYGAPPQHLVGETAHCRD